MNLSIVAGSYIASIDYIIHKTINASFLGCYLNSFDNTFKVDCFKSYSLTQLLCINFCSLRGGMCNNWEIPLAENTNTTFTNLHISQMFTSLTQQKNEHVNFITLYYILI